jgi:hypothetical protein
VSLPACKAKPSEQACKEAIDNVRRITEQSTSDMGADPIAMIRSCRGSSSKASVECMRVAKTLEDLNKCEGEIGEKYYKDEVKAAEDKMKKSDDTETPPAEDAAPEPAVPAASDAGSAAEAPAEAPAADKQAVPEEKPAAEKPAAEKPAAKKPATKKPAAEKPAAEKPAAEKPAAEKPAAEKPAAEKPATP